jgi:hypothetical protein
MHRNQRIFACILLHLRDTSRLKDRPIVALAAEAPTAETNPTITHWPERRGSQRIGITPISHSRWVSKPAHENATNLRGPPRRSIVLRVEKSLALTRRGMVTPWHGIDAVPAWLVRGCIDPGSVDAPALVNGQGFFNTEKERGPRSRVNETQLATLRLIDADRDLVPERSQGRSEGHPRLYLGPDRIASVEGVRYSP